MKTTLRYICQHPGCYRTLEMIDNGGGVWLACPMGHGKLHPLPVLRGAGLVLHVGGTRLTAPYVRGPFTVNPQNADHQR